MPFPEIKDVSDEEAEEAEAVVCMRKGIGPVYFDDNLEAPCARGCGHTVVFRPHTPKKPPKVCLECLVAAQ